MTVKIDPAEGYGAHRRSVQELAAEVQDVRVIAETASGGGIAEAPINGTSYVRKDGGWVVPVDKGYDTVGSFISLVNQLGLLDTPQTVTFGAGGSAGGYITVGADGVLSVVTTGYYSIKQRFRAGRQGAAGTSDVFFFAEISVDNGATWSTLGNSVDIALDNSKEVTVFFDISSVYLTAGVKLRNRFARNGDGDDSGDLLVGVPSATLAGLGVPSAPSAQVTIYKI